MLATTDLYKYPLKIVLWWFSHKMEVFLMGEAFTEFFKVIQEKAIISISLVWAVTKDTVPQKTTLLLTFHSLILCSNLGNCLNHCELIPVMPLPPPPLSSIRPMHRTTGPDSPWIPAKPNDFEVPRPLLVSVCLLSKIGQFFVCKHSSCQTVADSVFFFFFPYPQVMSKCEWFLCLIVLSPAVFFCNLKKTSTLVHNVCVCTAVGPMLE